MFGGSLALDIVAAASLLAVVRSVRDRRPPPPWAVLGTAATTGYVAGVRPWMARWGLGHEAGPAHAVEIGASTDRVWPWLAQIGQDRGGFYSYEWLENLAGCRMRNADRIHPEWQHREIGETVLLHPATGLPVTEFEPGRRLSLGGWGTFELEALTDGRTRLTATGERARGAARVFYVLLVELPHFVMERRMLLGIKRRAEAVDDLR